MKFRIPQATPLVIPAAGPKKNPGRVAKSIEKTVRDRYGATVFNTSIRRCVKVAECQVEHKDVIAYDPYCNASKDYRSLAEEIVAMVEKQDSNKTT